MCFLAACLLSATLAIGSEVRPQPAGAARERALAVPAQAAIDFSGVRNLVVFRRGTKAVTLVHYSLPVTITDPDGGTGDLDKILLDPSYVDPTHAPDADDFFVVIKDVGAVGSAVRLSSFALCKWRAGKMTARCAIEDDGGEYVFRVVARGATLRASRFAIDVSHTGFSIGVNDDGSGRPGIRVAARKARPVGVPMRFT